MSEERSRLPVVLLFALLFLIFFQLLAEFIEAVYAFGLLGTSVPPEILTVLLLFSPALLLLFPRSGPRALPHVLLSIVLLARILMPLMDTRGRMILAGIGTASWLLLFPLLLWRASRGNVRGQAAAMGTGLMLAVAASALLRTLGHGLDLSTFGWGQVIGWGLAVLTGWLWWRQMSEQPGASEGAAGGRNIMLPVQGMMAVLIPLYFVFTAPHVLARWTGTDYRVVLALFVVGLVVWGRLSAQGISRALLFGVSTVFIIALTTTALVHQVTFPVDPGAYPLPEAQVTPLHAVPLILTLILFPVLFLDFAWLVTRVLEARPSLPRLAGSFTLAALFLVVMIFAHVFTTVYDYIPVVGPFFRDRFWQIHLVVGIVLLVALPEVRERGPSLAGDSKQVLGVLLTLGVITLAGGLLVTARPTPPTEARREVRVMTYNVQQGYSEDGQRNFAGQLAVIRSVGPDLLGLQETDDARVANGNADIVRYFADNLNMYTYYGPKTVTGTFGIALLSRYPIRNPRTWFLYSRGEQVAVIEAEVTVGNRTFRVFVTHLGNGGPIVQQRQFLQLVQGKENVVAMGDFNFRPDTEQYRITTQVLVDTWTARWPQWKDSRGVAPRRKIDHIFVSPDVQVLDAQYLESPASDHPAVVAVISR